MRKSYHRYPYHRCLQAIGLETSESAELSPLLLHVMHHHDRTSKGTSIISDSRRLSQAVTHFHIFLVYRTLNTTHFACICCTTTPSPVVVTKKYNSTGGHVASAIEGADEYSTVLSVEDISLAALSSRGNGSTLTE